MQQQPALAELWLAGQERQALDDDAGDDVFDGLKVRVMSVSADNGF